MMTKITKNKAENKVTYEFTKTDTIKAIIEEFEKLLPKHKAGLSIRHNEHHGDYQGIEEYILELEKFDHIDDEDWATPTSRQRAIETDSLWEIRWYPNTPIGSNECYGATLEEVIQYTLDCG